jgi:hypothetical protein
MARFDARRAVARVAARSGWIGVLLLAGAGAAAQPVEVEGVRFEPTIVIGEQPLVLNGAGLRTRFGFRVYAAGLYVPAKSTDAPVLLAQTGPRRMALHMLRDVEGATFAKALADGLNDNLTEAERERLRAPITALDGIVRAIGSAKKGDVIQFDLTPEGMTRVVVNGQPRGDPLPGGEFYAAVLRVWLGERPSDAGLRKGLLGG